MQQQFAIQITSSKNHIVTQKMTLIIGGDLKLLHDTL